MIRAMYYKYNKGLLFDERRRNPGQMDAVESVGKETTG